MFFIFGCSGDQSETIVVTSLGGVTPYKIEITMNRPLLCNQINDAGDEIWTSSGGTTVNNGCPVYPNLAALSPISPQTVSSGSFSVKVILMADATLLQPSTFQLMLV